MKLSRTVAYALQATVLLAQEPPGIPVPCSRLAAEGKMPERFLLQILRNLVAHGILGSTRGVDGGYTLERLPEEITLLDLIEAIDGPMITTLPPSEGLSAESKDKLENVLNDTTAACRRQLQSIRLADLLPTALAGKN